VSPLGEGWSTHTVFFRENHANVATYCAAYIDVLARFRVWGEKKSHVNERDRAFTEKRLRWRSRSTAQRMHKVEEQVTVGSSWTWRR
jgi:hypothetical protein